MSTKVAEAPRNGGENNLTISTKMSTDKLICKSPRDSPESSVKSLEKTEVKEEAKVCTLLYLGVLQIAFGSLMGIFGVLVLINDASLSQIGGGLWGGCLAAATGTAGVLAAARDWCPLKSTPQRIAHTAFLALSLVSVAISQLVLVLAATGMARDIGKGREMSEDPHYPTTAAPPTPRDELLPRNYSAVLTNLGLLLASGVECVFAAISAYKSARALCECFRSPEDDLQARENYKNALVSSWLGKHSSPQPVYVIAAPSASTLSGRSKHSSNFQVAPIYPLPPPQPMHYPLIPAPLGPVPSPVIYPHPRELVHTGRRPHRRYPRVAPKRREEAAPKRSRSKSRSREKEVTTEDVAKTYTGLDRAIAEEFIEICDSRNLSLVSEGSSCPSSMCHCQHPCSGCASTCTNNSNV